MENNEIAIGALLAVTAGAIVLFFSSGTNTTPGPSNSNTGVKVSLSMPQTSDNVVSVSGTCSTTNTGATISSVGINWGDTSPVEDLPYSADGKFSSQYTYNSSGNYNITVTATDSTGATGTATASVSIAVGNNNVQQFINYTNANLQNYLSLQLQSLATSGEQQQYGQYLAGLETNINSGSITVQQAEQLWINYVKGLALQIQNEQTSNTSTTTGNYQNGQVDTVTPTGQGPYGSATNPVSYGNWYAGSAGVNFFNSGFYTMPNGQSYYFGSSSALVNYAQQNGYMTNSNNSTTTANPYFNTQSNPVEPGANGNLAWQGSGYYYLAKGNFAGNSQSAGTYLVTNQQTIANYNYWVNYQSPTIGTSTTSSNGAVSTSSTPTLSISVSPNTISQIDGTSITISGSSFPPNSSGMISSSGGSGISGYTTNNVGQFSVVVYYYFNATQVSGLAQAIKNSVNNFIEIRAYDYTAQKYSNSVPLYFA